MVADAFDQAQARDPDHTRTWIIVVDGDFHQIDLLRAEATRRHLNVHIVCDLVHVLQYLWRAAWCFHPPGDPAAEDWVAEHALAILAGHADQVAELIDTDTADLPVDRCEDAGTAVRYLRGHVEYLCYNTALARGWPIASGVIDGAARHLVRDSSKSLTADGDSTEPTPSCGYAPSSPTTTSPNIGHSA